jgi:hypothetical protein
VLAALKNFVRQPAYPPDPVTEPELAAAPASPSASASDPLPARRAAPEIKRIWLRGREPAPSHIPTPADDARQFLRWVAESGYAGSPVLAEDMRKVYVVFCKEVLKRAPYAWQLVAEPLRELTGGRKEYTRIRVEPGGKKDNRRCIYHIPADAV